MRYYLGLDAGGTKTFCLVGDADGHVLGFGKAGAGNYEAYGVREADTEIRRAVDTALEEAGLTLEQLSGVGMGIAGADIPEDYEMLEREIFGPLFGSTPKVFRNDSMAGLRGGTRDPFGIVIACGTGCVCAGVNRDGGETRVGGINEDFGDMVSGSSIGTEGLKAVWRHRDGITDAPQLTRAFVARAHCGDVDELFYKMYREELTYADLEPMARIVFDVAHDGSPVACDILEWGGRYLAEMVNAVARQLDMCRDTFDVVMAGSVFKGRSPVLIDMMRTRIHRECPEARLVMPAFEPVVGGLLLGMELAGPVSEAVYDTLTEELDTAAARYGIAFRSQ